MLRALRFISICGIGLALPFLGAAGCTVSQSRRATEKEAPLAAEDVKVSGEQLRLRMRSLVGPMCGKIEQSADAIIASASDVDVKLAALQWKMDGVPAMREALYRPDPYTAAFDTAVLCLQLIDYFDHGPGKAALGPAGAEAAAADCRRMADEYFKVIASSTKSGDVAAGRAMVEKWAAEHPIRHAIPDRESALTRVFEQEFSDGRRAAEYVADAAATADDLTRKLDVYSDQLFRQARWEVERLRLEVVRDYRVDQAVPLAERAVKSAETAVATVDRLAPQVERGLGVVYDTPKLITTEREAATKFVHDEVTRALQMIRDERVQAMDTVANQRAIASQELRSALDMQARQLADDAERVTTREVDYVMVKVWWLVGISMAVAGIAALLGLLFLRGVLVSAGREAARSAERQDGSTAKMRA